MASPNVIKSLFGFFILLGLLFAATQVKTTAPASGSKPQRKPANQQASAGTRFNPAEARRLNTLGVAYMNQQALAQGLEAFRAAQKKDPKLDTAKLNEAIALLNLQRPDEALPALLEITNRDPNNAIAWFNLGLLYRNTGKAEQAVAAFQKVAELDPRDAETWYFLGTLQMQLQRLPAAIESFEKTLAIAPFHVSAEFGLARALQRAGRTEEARVHLSRFEKLTREKLGAPISQIYGEQGKYSLAQDVPGAELKAGAPGNVTFAPADAGLKIDLGSVPAGALGSGACFVDLNNDGADDLVLLSRTEPKFTVYENRAGKFQQLTVQTAENAGTAVACTAGDFDNDKFNDLAISFTGGVHLYRNVEGRRLQDVTTAAGIEQRRGMPAGLTFLDYDHDGDVDLYVPYLGSGMAAANAVLWRNNGNQTFTDVTKQTGLGIPGALNATLTDVNNDRAVDLLVSGADGAPTLFLNPREGEFKKLDWGTAAPKDTVAASVCDFDHDGWMDLAFTHAAAPAVSVWRNNQGRTFSPVKLPDTGLARGWGLTCMDYDNDGYVDLAIAGADAAKHGVVRLFRNLGKSFEDVTASTKLDGLKADGLRALIHADFDLDGDEDLLAVANGAPALLLNDGGSRNHSLRLVAKGLNDNRAGIGTKVEVLAGGQRQKWEITASSGMFGQSSFAITAGLGSQPKADVVRLLWPGGVLQDEIEVAAAKPVVVDQIDRRGSSCPLVFAWDGTKYRFLTDVIGAGIVGHWVAPGQRNVPDPDEYLRIDADALKPRNGKLRLKILEPMEEVVYLDQVRLYAVDTPRGVDAYPNEYFAGDPPFPKFRLYLSRDAAPPARAWDSRGQDVTEMLAERDRRYTSGFDAEQFVGFAKPHTLTLELAQPYAGGPLRMLMHGFTDYFTATSMYAAHQANVIATVPYLEAERPDGTWIKVSDNIGFPAGLMRTMTADISGLLPMGTRRIRITSNLQIFWDQILFDTNANDQEYAEHEIPLTKADLNFHGYPREKVGNQRVDLDYEYTNVSPTGPYARAAGAYTRYGDVTRLVGRVDDQLSIVASGEVVTLDFDAARLPPLRAGWHRQYLLYVNGYSKDMDFYAADAATVEPVPYAGMKDYPYSEQRPDSNGEYMKYRLENNTRMISGADETSYRFEYSHDPIPRKKR